MITSDRDGTGVRDRTHQHPRSDTIRGPAPRRLILSVVMRFPLRVRTRESLIQRTLFAGYPILSFALAVLLISACRTLPDSHKASLPECSPRFEDQAGWYGADAAFSVPLSNDARRRTLWLFGDTFVERAKDPGKRSYPFVHNSIGLSVCDPIGGFSWTAHWRGQTTAKPRAFFIPAPDAEWVLSLIHI